MSQEVAIIAIARPNPEKLERWRELVAEGIEWIKANEPETLEFTLYEEHTPEGLKITMYERYASQAAMEKHENSENYQNLIKTMLGEQLVLGPPVIFRGARCAPQGFKR